MSEENENIENTENTNPAVFKLVDNVPGSLGKLKVYPERCWNNRTSRSRCTNCLEACPQECLDLALYPRIEQSKCDSCGLCAAACPTSSLVFPRLFSRGFLNSLTTINEGEKAPASLWLSCGLETATQKKEEVKTKLCLAVLDEGHFINLLAQGVEKIILDGRKCSSCQLIKGKEFLAEKVASTRAVMETHSITGEITLLTEQGPDGVSKAEPLPLLKEKTLSRRDFFGGFRSAEPQEEQYRVNGGGDSDIDGEIDLDMTEKLSLLNRLIDNKSRFVNPPKSPDNLPVRFINAKKDCILCGSCSIICPGQAISQNEDRFQATLVFNPLKCLGCDHCGDICPHDAFASRSLKKEDFPLQSSQVIFARKKVKCKKCEHPFISIKRKSICPNCEKLLEIDDEMMGILNW